MTFDHEVVLITRTAGENTLGDPITTETRRTVLCGQLSVTRSEHYQAAAHGLKPEIVLVVNKWDYEGEAELEFENKEYRVIRAFEPKLTKTLADFEKLELVCQGVINRGDAQIGNED